MVDRSPDLVNMSNSDICILDNQFFSNNMEEGEQHNRRKAELHVRQSFVKLSNFQNLGYFGKS